MTGGGVTRRSSLGGGLIYKWAGEEVAKVADRYHNLTGIVLGVVAGGTARIWWEYDSRSMSRVDTPHPGQIVGDAQEPRDSWDSIGINKSEAK